MISLTQGARLGTQLPKIIPPGAIAQHPARLAGLSTYLAIAALAMAMFGRVFTAAGAPTLVNFLHFPVTLGALMVVAPRIRSRAAKALLSASYFLLIVVFSSAFLNGAGLVNAILDFLLLVEPFLLLLLLTSSQMPPKHLRGFRHALLAIAAVHVAMAYYQHFALGLSDDDVTGVFLAQGAGSHVAGAVALTTAAYLLTSTFRTWTVLRVAAATACAAVVYFSDAKQVSLVFLVSLLLHSFRRSRPSTVARRLGLACLASLVFFGVAQLYLPRLVGWAKLENLSVGLRQKFSVFPLLESHFHSPLNWLLGLGPGHTCGRLGQLIPDYRASLEPLGITTSPVTAEVGRLTASNYFSNASSLWNPFFFWSGLFGDLGLAGVTCVVALWSLTWHLARESLARFLTINAVLFGIVFSWLEEPGYTLFVAATIALSRQESRKTEHRSWLRPESSAALKSL